jgi:hypothetical protein
MTTYECKALGDGDSDGGEGGEEGDDAFGDGDDGDDSDGDEDDVDDEGAVGVRSAYLGRRIAVVVSKVGRCRLTLG